MNDKCSFNIFNVPMSDQRIALATVSGLVAIPTTFLNFLVLYSFWRTPSLHKPSYILIANLALTDFIAGSIVLPWGIVKDITPLMKWKIDFCEVWRGGMVIGYWVGAMSLFIVTVISIDRLLAIKLKNRYPTIVTLKRTLALLIFWWIGAGILVMVLLTVADLPINLLAISSAVYQILMLVILSASYSYAFYALKKISLSVHISSNNDTSKEADSTPNARSFNVNRYRRSFNTMLLVVLCVMLFYLPLVISGLVGGIYLKNVEELGQDSFHLKFYKIYNVCELVVAFNSTVNPLLCLWRMKDLREAAFDTLKKFLRKKSSDNTQMDIINEC